MSCLLHVGCGDGINSSEVCLVFLGGQMLLSFLIEVVRNTIR